MDALEARALATCYPNGVSAPSISGKPIDIAQGWVIAEDLDQGLKAGISFVSIYAVPSSTSKLPVPLETGQSGIVIPPVHGMGAEPTDTGFLLFGVPGLGEYATAIVNGRAYSCSAAASDTAETIAATLATVISADMPGTTWAPVGNGASVTILGFSSLLVRIGAPATVGRIIDRQRQNILVGVWSPNPPDRAVIGRALKVAIGQSLKVEMPDTSFSLWIAQSENIIDKYQDELAYRRDLTVQCQFDTVETYPAYEVTVVRITTDPQSGSSPVSKSY